MNKKIKTVIALLVLILLIAAVGAAYLLNKPETSEGTKSITVEVIHGDGSAKTFDYTTDKEYLGELLLEEGLIAGEEGQFGLYIQVVDGEQAIYEQDQAYWALYQGGDYAPQGIDLTPINDGDSFKLIYTRD
ncbi:MAG: DUF4430 domain-containing protein [Christensenellales bacterium]